MKIYMNDTCIPAGPASNKAQYDVELFDTAPPADGGVVMRGIDRNTGWWFRFDLSIKEAMRICSIAQASPELSPTATLNDLVESGEYTPRPAGQAPELAMPYTPKSEEVLRHFDDSGAYASETPPRDIYADAARAVAQGHETLEEMASDVAEFNQEEDDGEAHMQRLADERERAELAAAIADSEAGIPRKGI